MPNAVKPKRSFTASAAPSTLAAGEIAVNPTDRRIWVGAADGTPVRMSDLPTGGAAGAVLAKQSATDFAVEWQTGFAKTNVVNAFTRAQYFAQATLTDAATISWNLDEAQAAQVTLGGARTLGAPTNRRAGATYMLLVKQDATGGRTLAFNAAYRFPGGTDPVMSTAANAVDLLSFYCDGTNLYGVGHLAFA
jgi:hypothetical protein